MLAPDVGVDHVVIDLRRRKNALGMYLFYFQLFSLMSDRRALPGRLMSFLTLSDGPG